MCCHDSGERGDASEIKSSRCSKMVHFCSLSVLFGVEKRGSETARKETKARDDIVGVITFAPVASLLPCVCACLCTCREAEVA